MSRKQFIESHGATCANWTWSWSFINEAERVVIFGAWDLYDDGSKALISVRIGKQAEEEGVSRDMPNPENTFVWLRKKSTS